MTVKPTALLAKAWDGVKMREGDWLRTPFLQEIYGTQLALLPGMEEALALGWLREQVESGAYDEILWVGSEARRTLRMLGLPENLDWYLRQLRRVLAESTVGQAIAPFVEPLLKTLLVGTEDLGKQAGAAVNVLERGKQAVADPRQVLAYLVATPETMAAMRYVWGSAQMVGVTVAGVLAAGSMPDDAFAPLPIGALAEAAGFVLAENARCLDAPKPLVVDGPRRQVRVFLPGFDKRQVKLTGFAQELAIEAGEQRRNIPLPPQFGSVGGAKFQDGYLLVSFR
ncbi:MAG: ArsA family ATPase [Oscillatoriales cyanobacterium SM2_1_8]|nr:ArsA family ATPase [Oscillatoriales cyanobacterium SM2_1_8]